MALDGPLPSTTLSQVLQRPLLYELDELWFDHSPRLVESAGIVIAAPVAPENAPLDEVRPLDRLEQISKQDFRGLASQAVSSPPAPERLDQAVPHQLLKSLGQEPGREISRLGDLVQRQDRRRWLLGQVDHGLQSVLALAAQVHSLKRPFGSFGSVAQKVGRRRSRVNDEWQENI